MANMNAPQATLQAELDELRATLAQQQALIESLAQTVSDQRATLGALQAERAPVALAQPADARSSEALDAAPTSQPGAGRPGRHSTSRRGLLRGAAAATAAVAAVAMGSAEQAHAAPLTSGGNLILGQSNDAGAPTALFPTASTTPSPLLQVLNDTLAGGTGIYSTGGAGGIGVEGEASGANGAGVFGVGGGVGSFGVSGVTDFGTGVSGVSRPLGGGGGGGVGVSGQASGATGIGGYFTGGRAPLSLGLAGSVGAPSRGAHDAGDIYLDSAAAMWLCVASGTPGTWVQLAHAVAGYSGGATTYLAKPIRLLDTRGSDPLANTDGGGPIAGGNPTGAPYALTIGGVNWQSVLVPSTAVGAIGNVTAVAGAGGGYLAIVPHGAGFSGTATLAFGPNQVVSNSFNTALSGGQLDILIGGSATDVILDLIAVVA